jgi:hypothetical protein
MEICAQGSVGILPAHTPWAATPERPIATTPLATFASSGSLRSCLRKSSISATASVAVHPRAARAQAECLGVKKGKRQNEEVRRAKGRGRKEEARRRVAYRRTSPWPVRPGLGVLLPSDFIVRCLTFANFVNFCSNFLCFLLSRSILRPSVNLFVESARCSFSSLLWSLISSNLPKLRYENPREIARS